MQVQTELITPSREPQPFGDVPTISVDRTLGHLFTGLALDTDSMGAFYGSLPHQDKRPLSDLIVHFSASRLIKDQDYTDDSVIYGLMLWEGTNEHERDIAPELPKTETPTIVVLAGSTIMRTAILMDAAGRASEETQKAMMDDLSLTLTHELTHYAQGPPETTLKPEKKSLNSKLKSSIKKLGWLGASTGLGLIKDTRWAKTGAAAFVASETLTDIGYPTSLKIAGGVAAIIHIAGKNKRSRDSSDRRMARYLEVYEEDPSEEDAEEHEEVLEGMVELGKPTLNLSLLKSITVYERSRMGPLPPKSLAKHAHKKVALKPAVQTKHT